MRSTKSILCAAALLLTSATADKGGHRNRALEHVNAAITEVAAGIRFDRRHEEEGAAPDQPRMQAALDRLQSARSNLEAASDDKGGHRVKALDHVNKAIEEVKKGIGYDRRN